MKENEVSQSHFDRVLIAIPSLGRPMAILKKTFALVNGAGIPFKIFVEKQEEFLYKHYCGYKNVEILPESGQGIGYSRNRMRDYAKANGYEFIFELDDDIDWFERLDTNDKQESLRMCVTDFVDAMDRFPKCGGIRMTHYRFWIYTKKDMQKWDAFNKHLIWASFMRLSALPPMSDKYTHFEDMAISLLLWREGYFTLNYGLAGVHVMQNQGKGGCNMGNRTKMAEEAIVEIKKEFPKAFQKDAKSYFGVNIDVDFYMKAYHCHSIKCKSDDELEDYLVRNPYLNAL